MVSVFHLYVIEELPLIFFQHMKNINLPCIIILIINSVPLICNKFKVFIRKKLILKCIKLIILISKSWTDCFWKLVVLLWNTVMFSRILPIYRTFERFYDYSNYSTFRLKLKLFHHLVIWVAHHDLQKLN